MGGEESGAGEDHQVSGWVRAGTHPCILRDTGREVGLKQHLERRGVWAKAGRVELELPASYLGGPPGETVSLRRLEAGSERPGKLSGLIPPPLLCDLLYCLFGSGIVLKEMLV